MLFGNAPFTHNYVRVGSVLVRTSLSMVAEWCLLVLIIINAAHGEAKVLVDDEEIEGDLITTLKLHRADIKDFFAVQAVNFLVGQRRNTTEFRRWTQIYETMTREFECEFSFVILTDQFYSENATFLNKFSRRDPEVEREGFVVSVGFDERVPFAFESLLLRDNAYYLVIVEEGEENEGIDELRLLQSFQRAFQKSGSITMTAIYRGCLWGFNPFKVAGNGSFGTLEPYQRSNNTLKTELLRTLNGYPLRVEFFESGYNIALYKDQPWVNSYLDEFIGPDAAAVNILRERVNFSGMAAYQSVA